MLKKLLLFLLTLLSLQAIQTQPTNLPDEAQLKKLIGHMLIVGFDGQKVDKNSSIVKDIQNYELGGVILFDKNYQDRTKQKNISSPQQLKSLTQTLKSSAKNELFIAIDQEGGRVARLKKEYGFTPAPSAKKVASLSTDKAHKLYQAQSKMLHDMGINLNFAPVVDLEINPDNKVIVGLKRSYGQSEDVVKYASIMIKEQEKEHIISALKHFPGHGSSLGDSHKGFVDVTKSWSAEELRPYINLIRANRVDMIMTAHVFNKDIDEKYPATLSYITNTLILREKLSYRGVIVSDDMQMSAITKHYSLKESVTLAINAGVDILLFGNQLAEQNTDELVDTIYKAVLSGDIPFSRILESNQRIENLHTKNSIVQTPIEFGEKRIALTKEYIKTHYGKDVKDITIEPKAIVLHWTAIMKLRWCMNAMKKEVLSAKRKNIVKASLLNVSSHFLVERDGTIHQLMPDNWMARHVIGLNYSAIGVENIGGFENRVEDLTDAQVKANIKLVNYLKQKYPKIEYLLGHHEYLKMQKTPLWLELDDNYRTRKDDPGKKFMKAVRKELQPLHLREP